ncbi:MAG: PIG-L family deacetylase [Flavobacteriaceae bacterium]|nr:PIG-L family deacetylase [Flavobacteriaceae bacterium]
MNTKPYLIEIKGNKMVLPKEIDGSYTVFCKVKLTSNPLGYLLSPMIEINGNTSSAQYFEARLRGYRYVNLSNLSDENGVIKFKTKRCSLTNEKVEVYAYKNEDISNNKILIIAPHPDDAEISAYGLYSRNAENTFILTLTGGEYGRNYYNVFKDKAKNDFVRMKSRIWNSLTVGMLGGVPINNALNLGYTDASLKGMYEEPNKTVPISEEKLEILKKMNPFYDNSFSQTDKSWNTLVSDIQQVIAKVQPNIIITAHPYLDKHGDHVYSTVAVSEALQKMNYDNGNLFLYNIHSALNCHYPFGKIGSMITVPPLFDDVECFDRIYSFELTKDEQATKILAFEAMNDLRIGIKVLSPKKLFVRALDLLSRRIFDIQKDYYSQFIRSNELFYVVPFSKATDFVENTLKKVNER